MKKFALTASALALMAASFASSTVWAQTPAPSATGTPPPMAGKPHRPHIDKDGDKMISREEAKGHPHLEKNFDAIDTNKDGKLSPEERKAFRAAHKGEHMKKLDTNGDKMISRDEAKGHPKLEKNFDAIDTNKDGKLSPEELKAFRAAKRPAPPVTK
jgi:EF hand